MASKWTSEYHREYQRRYRAANKDKVRALNADYKRRNSELVKEWSRAWQRKNREKISRNRQSKRDQYIVRVYGVTLERARELLDVKECQICGEAERQIAVESKRVGKFTRSSLVVDHCHTSGVVRGMLCGRCNTSIGQFEDSPDLLYAAAAYLDRQRKAA